MQEVNNMEEIVKFENGLITCADELCQKMCELNAAQKKLDGMKKDIQAQLLEIMRANGIKKFNNDYFTATYIAPSKRENIDKAVIKVMYPEAYEAALTETEISDSVRLTFKK